MNKTSVQKILTVVSPEAVERACGVGEHAIRHYRNVGYFPGSWFGPLEKLCLAAKIECPRDAFNWKSEKPSTDETTRGAA